MVNPLGIERLCVFGMPPVEFVNFAADLGCRHIGLGTETLNPYNPFGFRDWSLLTEPALRRATAAALADRGVAVSLFEGFGLDSGDISGYARDLDVVRELGGTLVNTVTWSTDLDAVADRIGTLAALAADRDIEVVIEVGVGSMMTVAGTADFVGRLGCPNVKLLIDTMHFFRRGSTIESLRALSPELVGYLQLCDVPAVSRFDTYQEESLHDRLPPGAGDLPLASVLAAIRPDAVVSLEVPERARVDAGEDLVTIVGDAVAAARRLLADVAAGGHAPRSDP